MRVLSWVVVALAQLLVVVPAASAQSWWMRNSNTPGAPDISLVYGNPGDVPVTGDWDGNGTTTVGVFRQANWLLRDSNTTGIAQYNFYFGLPGDLPFTGRWGTYIRDGIGVYRSGHSWRRHTASGGPPDFYNAFGTATGKPIAGRYNILSGYVFGYFEPSNASWFLRTPQGDVGWFYGNPGDIPLMGDWDGDGYDTPGVYRPSTSYFWLSNSPNGTGPLIPIEFGLPWDKPVVGDWDGNGTDTIGVVRGM